MAYTIVNGPMVMSCSADPNVTVDVKFIYDDAEASMKTVQIAIDDTIKVKYMAGAYSPVVAEAEGRINSFSVVRDREGGMIGSCKIQKTLGEVKSLELDCSSANRGSIINIPIAAIRELTIINTQTGDKPDCEFPGLNCPNNPYCTCPGYVQPVCDNPDCPVHDTKDEIDIDGDGIPDVVIDDSGIMNNDLIKWRSEGYKCVFKGKPYKDLQEAINNVICPCVDVIMDAIILIDNIDNDEALVNYTISGPCIIRSLTGLGRKQYYIEGSFTVNSNEMVTFYNLLIVHKGIGKEAIAIDAVNASLSVQKCTFVFDNKTFKIDQDTVELPMAIRVTRLDTDRVYENVVIKNNEFANYPEASINNNETLSTCILFTRNFGSCYGDFKYIIEDNKVSEETICTSAPHLLFVDQNFNGEGTADKLECSGIACSEDGLKELLHYQGKDTFIDVAGVVDLDKESFSVTIREDSKLTVTGLLNLGTNILTNYGKVVLSGIITGGIIINNNKVTYKIPTTKRTSEFFNTKIRTNGTQRLLKRSDLEEEK